MSSDTMIALIGTVLVASVCVVAFVFYQRASREEAGAELRRDAGEADVDRLQKIKDYLRLMAGPFPLSIALHVIALLFLIITVHEQRRSQLIMVNLEAGGGGGSNETQELDMPEVPMPDLAQSQVAAPAAVTSDAVSLANNYVRAAGGGGIGIGRGGGMGSVYGAGIGSGFGGFIGELRRHGLDVMLVIDGTGSMGLIIGDVKTKMEELVDAVHRLVPIARIGIIVYGGPSDPLQIQPLTLNTQKLIAFLGGVKAVGGGEWSENMLGACQTAVDKMGWKPYAKKVIVLVGDSPPAKEDFSALLQLVRHFKSENGTFNTVDVTPQEHERFERAFYEKVHHEEPPKISPLPEFDKQTQASFKVLAHAGGGSMKSLIGKGQVNQQVLILAFGDQWQSQVKEFGRGMAGK